MFSTSIRMNTPSAQTHELHENEKVKPNLFEKSLEIIKSKHIPLADLFSFVLSPELKSKYGFSYTSTLVLTNQEKETLSYLYVSDGGWGIGPQMPRKFQILLGALFIKTNQKIAQALNGYDHALQASCLNFNYTVGFKNWIMEAPNLPLDLKEKIIFELDKSYFEDGGVKFESTSHVFTRIDSTFPIFTIEGKNVPWQGVDCEIDQSTEQLSVMSSIRATVPSINTTILSQTEKEKSNLFEASLKIVKEQNLTLQDLFSVALPPSIKNAYNFNYSNSVELNDKEKETLSYLYISDSDWAGPEISRKFQILLAALFIKIKPEDIIVKNGYNNLFPSMKLEFNYTEFKNWIYQNKNLPFELRKRIISCLRQSYFEEKGIKHSFHHLTHHTFKFNVAGGSFEWQEEMTTKQINPQPHSWAFSKS